MVKNKFINSNILKDCLYNLITLKEKDDISNLFFFSLTQKYSQLSSQISRKTILHRNLFLAVTNLIIDRIRVHKQIVFSLYYYVININKVYKTIMNCVININIFLL